MDWSAWCLAYCHRCFFRERFKEVWPTFILSFCFQFGHLSSFFVVGQAIVSSASNTVIGDLNARWAAAGLVEPLIVIGLLEVLLGTILIIISRVMKPKVIPTNEV